MKKFFLLTAMLFCLVGARAQSFTLVSLGATNDYGTHVRYQFYCTDDTTYRMSVVAKIFQSSTQMGEISLSGMKGSAMVDTGWSLPSSGTYYILMWGFDNSGGWANIDTTWIMVHNYTAVENTAVENNPEGIAKIISLNGVTVTQEKSFFDERNKISKNNIPPGIYLQEFISNSKQTHVIEKIGIIPN